jgi:diadenosine tetraphosphate (Ap4A) HIT family hydrolase
MSELPAACSSLVADCDFCGIAERAPELPYDVVQPLKLDAGSNLLLKPSRGMLTAGHLLLITEPHLESFAELPQETLPEVEQAIIHCLDYLERRFGDYVVVEHGSRGAGGCINHAHTHLVPTAGELEEMMMQEQLPWRRLDSYEEIADFQDQPYLLLSKGLGRLASIHSVANQRSVGHYIVPNPQLRGQWVQRQIAGQRNLADYDWALPDPVWAESAAFETLIGLGLKPGSDQDSNWYYDYEMQRPRVGSGRSPEAKAQLEAWRMVDIPESRVSAGVSRSIDDSTGTRPLLLQPVMGASRLG